MHPTVSKILNINRPSVALIIIAWLAFNFNSIFLNYPIKIDDLLLFFLSLFFLEIIFIFISNKKISLLILLNVFLFLFGFLLIINILNITNILLNLEIRGRIIFMLLFKVNVFRFKYLIQLMRTATWDLMFFSIEQQVFLIFGNVKKNSIFH